jgi:hypothetical protein
LTIVPSPERRSAGRNALTPYTVPQKLMFINHSISSIDSSDTSPAIETPALLISTSTRRCSRSASAANSSTADFCATSSTCVETFVRRSTSCAVSARLAASRSASASA